MSSSASGAAPTSWAAPTNALVDRARSERCGPGRTRARAPSPHRRVPLRRPDGGVCGASARKRPRGLRRPDWHGDRGTGRALIAEPRETSAACARSDARSHEGAARLLTQTAPHEPAEPLRAAVALVALVPVHARDERQAHWQRDSWNQRPAPGEVRGERARDGRHEYPSRRRAPRRRQSRARGRRSSDRARAPRARRRRTSGARPAPRRGARGAA